MQRSTGRFASLTVVTLLVLPLVAQATESLPLLTSPPDIFTMDSTAKMCGDHYVSFAREQVTVDNVSVPSGGRAPIANSLTCRSDGKAVAWVERGTREMQLVVVPDLEKSQELFIWPLSEQMAKSRLYWTSKRKIVLGPAPFRPRAVASWVE